ncbi:MAG: sensor histidine kinase [Planctomycetota bacterium]
MIALKLRTRILAWFVGLTALLLAGFSGTLYVQSRDALIDGVDEALRGRAEALAMRVECEGGRFGLEPQEVAGAEAWEREKITAGAVFTLPAGKPVGYVGTEDAQPALFEPDLRWWLEGGGPYEFSRPPRVETRRSPDGRSLRMFSGLYRIEVEGLPIEYLRQLQREGVEVDLVTVGSATILVTVAASLEDVEEDLGELLALLFTVGPVALLAAVFCGWFLARRIAGPIAAIAQTAETLQASDLARTVPTTGTGDEIDRLAGTLNSTFERLRAAFERQTRFTADAAHELRTPLTVVKSHAQVALSRPGGDAEDREALREIVGAADRLHELMEKLLFLARSDDRQLQASFEPLDLAELAKEAVKEFEEAAIKKSVALHAETAGTVPLSGDRTLLAMLLRNLLDNALRHSPEGGAVRVGLTAEKEGIALTVRDEGPGIPLEVRSRIFERFFRLEEGRDRASGGTGLGLAIVKTVAEVHGAEVSAEAREEKGTVFRILFPKSRPPG